MYLASDWKDYEIIDAGGGNKHERWADVTLLRPDPQAVWPMKEPRSVHARYIRSSAGGGHWEYGRALPESWKIRYRDLTFIVRPTGFKHTGLFPEQAVNWDWMRGIVEKSGKPFRVLNLFAYTGGATAALAASGAEVVHVDAAKGMVAWGRENARLSGLEQAPIRWIVDDCGKFLEREIRRGRRYDALIMDPPSYGRGPGGEVWKLERDLWPFVELAAQVLSDDPLFVIINSYTTGLAPSVVGYILNSIITRRHGGGAVCDELGLPVTASGLALPCGAAGRWMGASLWDTQSSSGM